VRRTHISGAVVVSTEKVYAGLRWLRERNAVACWPLRACLYHCGGAATFRWVELWDARRLVHLPSCALSEPVHFPLQRLCVLAGVVPASAYTTSFDA